MKIMKCLVIIVSLMFGINSWGQNPVAAVQLSEYNILYRGYENKVIPVVTNNSGKEVRLVGTTSTVEKVENEDYFIVKLTGRGKTEVLHVLLYDGKKTDTVQSIRYRVQNLPAPEIYWGGLRSGGIGNITAKRLSIDYPEGVQLRNDFRIISWEITVKGEVIKGNGDKLTSAEDFLKKIENGTILLFKVKVLSPDGITRIMSAQWEVQSWKEEVKMNPLGFDRE